MARDRIVDAANWREGSTVKVGGHQASCASMVSIMTALWFGHLDGEDKVAVKPHASPVYHAIKYLTGELETDGRIAALDLVVVEDDKNFFPLYNAAPVFIADVYGQYGDELEALFEPVALALDNDTVAELNARVSAEGERPEAVARDFLEENGFLTGS